MERDSSANTEVVNVSVSGKRSIGIREGGIPSAYRAGYEKAAALDPELAMQYVEHTVIDDPVADAVIEALAVFGYRERRRLIHAGMERDAEVLAQAPRPLRDFFEEVERPPAWFDPDAALPARQALLEHLDLFVTAFVTVTLRNFVSLMSKVFLTTGQTTTRQGVRRLRENLRYLVEMMMFPNALEPRGESWKFSIRIRLTHAEIRRRIRSSGGWDEAVYGAPVSAANMALASANFSASSIRDAERLGATLNADARAGIMRIWRCASWLMGTPESLLFDGDEAETSAFLRIAHLCEPPVDEESVQTSNAVIYLLPEVAGLTDRTAKRSTVENAYAVSRAILGDALADRLKFPPPPASPRTSPGLPTWNVEPFAPLLDAAIVDDLRSRLPDRVETARPSPGAGSSRPGATYSF